jgi:hypothetical protein
VLFLVVGLGNFAAAALEAARAPRSELVSTVAGSALTGWILVQLAMQGSLNWLQLLFFAVGATTVVGSLWLWRQRHPLPPQRRITRLSPSPLAGRGLG